MARTNPHQIGTPETALAIEQREREVGSFSAAVMTGPETPSPFCERIERI
jgi:hypothetical protein